MTWKETTLQWLRQLSRRLRQRRTLLRIAAAIAIGVTVAAIIRSGLECPPPSLLVLDRHSRFLGEIGLDPQGEAGYWPLETLPPRVVAATLAIEDRRFRLHPGVDPLAVLRALRQNLAAGEVRSGASTLAMQVARMQHPGARTLPRKALEATTAIALTLRHGRDDLLAHYLRIAPYGNRIHGIAYAARRYLNKPVEDLSWAEVALLTALPQAPGRMNPLDPRGRKRALTRAGAILDRLAADGALAPPENASAHAELARLHFPPLGDRPAATLHALLRLERDLGTPAAREARAFSPIVRTPLDLELQDDLTARTARAVERFRPRGAGNAAVILVEMPEFAVRAWVGSSGYFDSAAAGAIDYATVERSPGSTLKPFLYALALERGEIDPASILDDLGRGAGGIGNADGRFLGPLLPRVALANSRNVPAANLLDRIGLDEGWRFFRDLGLHDGGRAPERVGLGLAIGGLPTTLERLVAGYTVLAGDGHRHALRLDQAPLPTSPHDRERVLSEDVARQITLFLADPSARLPSFPRMGASELPFPAAIKTGTSSGYHDAWAVAWTDRYLLGIWIGHPDFRPMNGLSGYRSAAELANEILLSLHRDRAQGLDQTGFPPPRGYRPSRICALSGGLAGDACDRSASEWFASGTEPVDRCRVHRRVWVDRATNRLADRRTPPSRRRERIAVELPARYAAWLASSGLTEMPARASAVPRLTIASPERDLHILRDPETPAALATLALRAVLEPPTAQVVWYVDGLPFQLVERPYLARWPLAPGEHVVEARAPALGLRSRAVRVVVE